MVRQLGRQAFFVILFAATGAAAQTVTGSGTSGTVPVFTDTSTVSNSPISISGSNVGIGTTEPTYPLHLNTGETLRIEGGANATDNANYFSFGGTGTFGIDAPGVNNGRFVVLDNGNVGIGVAVPNAAL